MDELFEQISSSNFDDKVTIENSSAVVRVARGNDHLNQPFLDNLVIAYGTQIKFFNLIEQDSFEILNRYKLEEDSVLLFFKNGNLVEKIAGFAHRTIVSIKVHALVN